MYDVKKLKKMGIKFYPEMILRQSSSSIDLVDNEIEALADEMLRIVYAAPGAGLSAIQIGRPLALFVIDIGYEQDRRDPKIYINPTIHTNSEECISIEEGCLSIPNIYIDVPRYKTITVRYKDITGSLKEDRLENLGAIVFQHELDHLSGNLIIDKVSRLKRDMIFRKYNKINKFESGIKGKTLT